MIYNIDIEVVWKYYNKTLLSLSHVSAFMKQVHVLLFIQFHIETKTFFRFNLLLIICFFNF